MSIKDEIKGLIISNGKTMSEIIAEINKKRDINHQETLSNLSGKLSRGTIKYSEVLEILEILDYEIKFVKNKKETE